ncbi:MAG TPA: hypothetical protein VFI42_02220, partial [Thermomicrobiaceae bacterium]|nr:hypothetical protein [Thermomicrobiaceae bacterium]
RLPASTEDLLDERDLIQRFDRHGQQTYLPVLLLHLSDARFDVDLTGRQSGGVRCLLDAAQ